MLQQGYYEVDSTLVPIAQGTELNNSTPFSVKDILNLVDQQGEPYIGCGLETQTHPSYFDYDGYSMVPHSFIPQNHYQSYSSHYDYQHPYPAYTPASNNESEILKYNESSQIQNENCIKMESQSPELNKLNYSFCSTEPINSRSPDEYLETGSTYASPVTSEHVQELDSMCNLNEKSINQSKNFFFLLIFNFFINFLLFFFLQKLNVTM